MPSKIDAIELFADEIAEAQSLPIVIPAPDPSLMPEEFAKASALALRAVQEILAMPIEKDDEHFRAKLGAKAAVASQQITAQLKADDQRVKAKATELKLSYYAELRKLLDDYLAKEGNNDA